ncbi:MAG: endonuclease/exonuclease/phosphatase family protein [Anaerolineae bacterium]
MDHKSYPLLLRVFGNLFTALSGAYGLSAAGFLGLRALVGEASGVIGFLNNFLHLLLLPALVLLPVWTLLALAKRRVWALLLVLTQLPAALTFLQAYGVRFLPRASAGNAAFAVLTYNLHAEQQDVSGMIAVMRESGADVVAVQELSAFAAEALRAGLQDVYPYLALYPGAARPTHGQGILSRYPILEEAYWQNNELPNTMGHLRALIDLNGARVAFYNTHPIHPGMTGSFYNDQTRGAEINIVLERAARESVPVVILGDFNMGEWSDDYGRITARFVDVYRAVGYGLGLSFPEWSRADTLPGFRARALPLPPILRLDFVFVGRLRPVEARVWHTAGGSDHYPVFVRLGF